MPGVPLISSPSHKLITRGSCPFDCFYRPDSLRNVFHVYWLPLPLGTQLCKHLCIFFQALGEIVIILQIRVVSLQVGYQYPHFIFMKRIGYRLAHAIKRLLVVLSGEAVAE